MTDQTDNTRPKPAFTAYVIPEKREGQEKAHWHEIGAAWTHKDGEGLDLVLVASPLTGRIVLRKPKS